MKDDPLTIELVLPERRTAFRNMAANGMAIVRQFKREWTLHPGWEQAVFAMVLADELDLHGATQAVDTDKIRAVTVRWAAAADANIGEILERGR